MAPTDKPGSEKVTDNAKNATENVAEIGKRAAGAAQLVRRTTEAAGQGVQRQVAHRSAEATAELGQALVDLLNEQTSAQRRDPQGAHRRGRLGPGAPGPG